MLNLQSLARASLLSLAFIGSAFAGQIDYTAQGSWNVTTGTSPSYWADKGLWIDASVQNLSSAKKVGIAWTDDNWATNHVSYLKYEYTLPNGREQWGIDFSPLGRLSSYYIGGWSNYVTGTSRAGGTTVTIKYSLFTEQNGTTYWNDNNGNNYSITLSL